MTRLSSLLTTPRAPLLSLPPQRCPRLQVNLPLCREHPSCHHLRHRMSTDAISDRNQAPELTVHRLLCRPSSSSSGTPSNTATLTNVTIISSIPAPISTPTPSKDAPGIPTETNGTSQIPANPTPLSHSPDTPIGASNDPPSNPTVGSTYVQHFCPRSFNS